MFPIVKFAYAKDENIPPTALDTPLTKEEVEILDALPNAQMPLEEIKVTDEESAVDILLKRDPCFLVKHPSGSEEILQKARQLCNKTQ
ncbi:MAG: hypothetical protein R3A45_04000 [Bdellovibrionota bacterium]